MPVFGMVVAIKTHEISQETIINSQNIEKTHLTFPSFEDQLGCVQVNLLALDGSWHERRLMWTHSILGFAKVEEDALTDAIPLFEISMLEDDVESALSLDQGQKIRPPEISKEIAGTTKNSTQSRLVNSLFPVFKRGNPVQRRPTAIRRLSAMFRRRSSFFSGKVEGDEVMVRIETEPNGYNSGRAYFLRVAGQAERKRLVSDLQTLVAMERDKMREKMQFRRSQARVEKFIGSALFQIFFAILIGVNFLANVLEMQVTTGLLNEDGSRNAFGNMLAGADIFFTVIFTCELALTLYAYWLRPFFRQGWNIFDLVVVGLSLLSVGPLNVPVIVVRSLRAFRVARLFRRVRSLQRIISALTSCIVPTLHSFAVMLIASSIFAIMGVTLFAEDSPEEFGVFFRAWITLFRITSGDPWAEFMPPFEEDGSPRPLVCFFMISYVVIMSWTLLQICVAVLIDSFVTAQAQMHCEEHDIVKSKQRDRERVENPIDPILDRLMSNFIDEEDLSRRIGQLFEVLDSEGSGVLSLSQLCIELRKLSFTPQLHITEKDLAIIFAPELQAGPLGRKELESALKRHMGFFVQRQLADQLTAGWPNDIDAAVMRGTKLCLLELASAREDRASTVGTLHQLQDQMLDLRHQLCAADIRLHRAASAPSSPVVFSSVPSSSSSSPQLRSDAGVAFTAAGSADCTVQHTSSWRKSDSEGECRGDGVGGEVENCRRGTWGVGRYVVGLASRCRARMTSSGLSPAPNMLAQESFPNPSPGALPKTASVTLSEWRGPHTRRNVSTAGLQMSFRPAHSNQAKAASDKNGGAGNGKNGTASVPELPAAERFKANVTDFEAGATNDLAVAGVSADLEAGAVPCANEDLRLQARSSRSSPFSPVAYSSVPPSRSPPPFSTPLFPVTAHEERGAMSVERSIFFKVNQAGGSALPHSHCSSVDADEVGEVGRFKKSRPDTTHEELDSAGVGTTQISLLGPAQQTAPPSLPKSPVADSCESIPRQISPTSDSALGLELAHHLV